MINLKQYKSNAKSFSDLLIYSDMVAPGVILTKNGSYIAGFELTGHDTTSLIESDKSHISGRLSSAFSKLVGGFTIHIDQVLVPAKGYEIFENSHFPDEFSTILENEKKELFSKNSFYNTKKILYLTYQPENIVSKKIQDLFIKQEQFVKDEGSKIEKDIQFFEKKIEEIAGQLTDVYFSVKRLGPIEVPTESGDIVIYDDLLRFINYSISGENHPFILPNPPSYLDSFLAKDVFGGTNIKIGNRYLKTISISKFPEESHPEMFRDLDSLGVEYRWNTRFICLDQTEALAILNKKSREWLGKMQGIMTAIFKPGTGSVNRDAVVMVDELEAAKADCNSGNVKFGYYTCTIIVSDEVLETSDEKAKLIVKTINRIGFTAQIENVNSLEALLGSFPGHTVENIRRPLIHSLNLADFSPVCSMWMGHDKNPNPLYPRNSPPLMQCIGQGFSPFRLNIHVGDVGYVLVLGSTGGGKSYLLIAFICAFLRYKNAQIFNFDKDNSLLGVTLACQGSHYDIGSKNSDLFFNPLERIRESEKELEWINNWIISFFALINIKVDSVQKKSILKSLNILAEMKDITPTLGEFYKNLDDIILKRNLEPYLTGISNRLLNSKKDTLSFKNLSTFEMGSLINEKEELVLPVLEYIFHRIEARLDGRPTLIVLDEAWLFFNHPLFREKLKEWLATLRKKNVSIVLATQAIEQVKESGLFPIVNSSCKTKILLPNPNAKNESNIPLYKEIGLNDFQIDTIKNAREKREYYYYSENGYRLFELVNGEIAHQICSATSKKDSEKIKSYFNQYGQDWLRYWYQSKGIKI